MCPVWAAVRGIVAVLAAADSTWGGPGAGDVRVSPKPRAKGLTRRRAILAGEERSRGEVLMPGADSGVRWCYTPNGRAEGAVVSTQNGRKFCWKLPPYPCQRSFAYGQSKARLPAPFPWKRFGISDNARWPYLDQQERVKEEWQENVGELRWRLWFCKSLLALSMPGASSVNRSRSQISLDR